MENTSYEKLQELKEFFYKETGNYPSSATTSIMISNIALQEQIEKLNLLNATTANNIKSNPPIITNDTKVKTQNNTQSFFNGLISLIWNIFFISSIVSILFFFLAPKIGLFQKKDTFNTDFRTYNDIEEYQIPKIPVKKYVLKSPEIKPFMLEDTEYYKLTQNNVDSLVNLEN
jgi:hypothetical protein